MKVQVSVIDDDLDKDLFLIEAVKAIKERKPFNQFVKEQEKLIKLLNYSEIEVKEIWNDAWFSVGMTFRVKQKVYENLEDKNEGLYSAN